MYSAKHEKYPIVPKSLDEIKISGDFAKCEDNSRFLIEDTTEYDPEAKENVRIVV